MSLGHGGYRQSDKKMIHIDVNMNRLLADAIDIIEIYGENIGCVRYSLWLDHRSKYTFFFELEKKYITTELKILFRKYCSEIPHGVLSRMPTQTIRTEILPVPELSFK